MKADSAKLAIVSTVCLLIGTVAAVPGTSSEFLLSIKHDGVRTSTGEETLRYSNLWDGNADATVTIRQNGTPLATSLTGEGERAWSVTRNGTYALTHTTYTNGVVAKVEHATFVVTGKDIPFPTDVSVTGYEGEYDGAGHGIAVLASGVADLQVRYARSANGPFATQMPLFTNVVSATTVWCELSAPGYITQTNSATVTITKRPVTLTSGSASKVYDGTALTKQTVSVSGSGWVAGEGATYTYTGTRTAVGSSANMFAYALKSGTLAGNYAITTKTGTLTVTKATLGGDEPGPGSIPEDGLSKFDARYVYDGEGHTIKTNELVAAFSALLGVEPFAVEYARGEDGGAGVPALPEVPVWLAIAPVFRAVGEYVVWYRVTSANYEVYVHAAKVTIKNPPEVLNAVAHPRYPWNGLVDVDFDLSCELADVQVPLTMIVLDNAGGTNLPCHTVWVDGVAAEQIQVKGGHHLVTWDAAADLPDGFASDRVAVDVKTVVTELGGVQLWENGPYWAECNVGATKPEEYGYYFWWGDTVGYTRSGGTWDVYDEYYSGVTWVSSTGTRMSSSPFSLSSCPTYNKSNSTLQSQGYVDSTGNLVAKYDAATVHLGAPWRMPTDAEWGALISNCTTTWTTRNGVYGRLVMGKGAYASKSIFLPAAGDGSGSGLFRPGSYGFYWSSTPSSDDSRDAWSLGFSSGNFYRRDYGYRYSGQSVRPLRGFAK